MKEQRLCNSRAQSLKIIVLKILAEGKNEEGREGQRRVRREGKRKEGREAEVYNFPDRFRAFSITEVLSSVVGSLVSLLTVFSLG